MHFYGNLFQPKKKNKDNCNFISHNFDYISCNSEIITCNFDFISNNSYFITCNSDKQLLLHFMQFRLYFKLFPTL